MNRTYDLVSLVRKALAECGDPKRAAEMAAYMKTGMPFYGVSAAPRREVAREAARRFPPADRCDYARAVRALWRQPHREEKYVAIAYARAFKKHVVAASLPLYEKMIREGAWWDLVDEIAAHLVGGALAKEPEAAWPIMDRWISDNDMWVRRAAILCQLPFRERADEARLFRYCAERAHERELFIRKAIGWALRQHARVAPEAVRRFVLSHNLSPLSAREAFKHSHGSTESRTGRSVS